MASRPRLAASKAALGVLRRSPELSPANSPPRPERDRRQRQRPAAAATLFRRTPQEAWAMDSLASSDAEPSPSLGPASPPSGGAVGLSSVRFAYGGSVHSLLLSADLSPLEAQNIVKAVFKLRESVVGVFEPQRSIVFPFSLVVREPASFPAVYFLVLEQSGVHTSDLPAETLEDDSLQLSAESSPQASPQRIAPRLLQQLAEPSARAASSASPRANAALQKAQQLTRLAAASPSPSGSDVSEDELSELSTDYDQPIPDEEAEQAAFEQAVDAALARAKQQDKEQKQQRSQKQLATRPQQASREARKLEERLLRDLGDYDDGGFNAAPDRRGADSEEAEAMRQTFWQRQREAVYLEAERRALETSKQQLNHQRAAIARLRAEQAHLLQLQAHRLAALQAHEAEAAAKRAVLRAAQGRSSSSRSRQQLAQLAQSSEEEFEEDEEEDEAAYPSESEGESCVPDVEAPSRFVLSPKELVELEDLQVQTGFASVAPSALFTLFRERCSKDGRLSRAAFDAAAATFARQVRPQLADDACARKSVLVLSRLFDLFAAQDGQVAFAHFVAGLSIIVQGDRDEKIRLALAAFDRASYGALSFSSLVSYFECFFRVVFDLSVSLQAAILPHASPAQLAHATAVQVFSSSPTVDTAKPLAQQHVTFAHLRQWYAEQDAAAASPSCSQEASEEDDEEEDEEDEEDKEEEDAFDESEGSVFDGDNVEDDEEGAVARGLDAAAEARHLARQLQEQQQRFREYRAQLAKQQLHQHSSRAR